MSPDFIPIPRERAIHRPYTSMWLGPFGLVSGYGVAGLLIAAWIWRKAPVVDNARQEF